MYLINFASNLRKQYWCLFLYIVVTTFSNFQESFFCISPIDFAHTTSHKKPPKNDSTSGKKKSPYIAKKVGGRGCGSKQAPLKLLFLLYKLWRPLKALWMSYEFSCGVILKRQIFLCKKLEHDHFSIVVDGHILHQIFFHRPIEQ